MLNTIEQLLGSDVPKVTIILNCLNGEAFLAEALDSAIAQTFTDWELVLFDDLSTDGSPELFKSYDEPRFRYVLAEKQLDLTAAREAAISHARGQWLAFLDQDDIWLPDKLEQQLALLNTPDADRVGIIYGRTTRFGYIDEGRDFDFHYEGRALPESDVFDELALVANFIPMSAALLRRAAYEEMGALPANVRLCPDYYYWMSVSRRWKVRALQDVCCHYRVRGSDFTSSNGIQVFTELLNVIEHFGEELEPSVLAKRRRSCHNLIATAELGAGLPVKGLVRIFRQGSVFQFIKRVPMYLFRVTRNFFTFRKSVSE